ncbi:MAG: hypothetical protein HQL22_07075, partial [Candidatus Omnitrophica bacterium]|nr:hypothetical protein [Candidatus Omnitrophota bacterium]
FRYQRGFEIIFISRLAVGAFARQKGVPIVLVYCPEYVEAKTFFWHHDEIVAYYQRISRENGVVFLDYSSLPMTLSKEWFYNSQHLNRSGAREFSSIFGWDIRGLLSSKE